MRRVWQFVRDVFAFLGFLYELHMEARAKKALLRLMTKNTKDRHDRGEV